jgi:hypothetical protein
MRMIFGAIGGMKIGWENLPQRHFVHHKIPHDTRSRTPDRSGGKPVTNRLSYGAAFFIVPFRRLLRLAGSRWRYSTPPLHGFRDVITRTAGAMSSVDSSGVQCQPGGNGVTTEEKKISIVKIRYQETTDESRLRRLSMCSSAL